MNNPEAAVPVLLNDLYECTANSEKWPVFLGKLANLFRSDTASLRLTDLRDPVVYHSYTTGFQQQANHRYESSAVELDPFREPLASNPIGAVVESTAIISDAAFERSEHYQTVFRPNGNFYAMGTQFERMGDRGMHIGIHRAKRQGPFDQQETGTLALFSPHLRRAAQLSQLLTTLNQTLAQANYAMDHLPFGVWQMDGQMRIQWMNAAADDALSANTYGLGLRGNHLWADAGKAPGSLKASVRALAEHQTHSETVKLGQTGACLVMTQSHQAGNDLHISRPLDAGILCFLLDADRPAQLDQSQLCTMYQLTLAEYRLASLLVTGLDISEASASLQISPHTGRTQLKSIMHKTAVNRQANLQRKLLLCADTLRKPGE
ncbi:MAG: helix-turn-helix transcriptional regulator [Pseudomonadota bacterium]